MILTVLVPLGCGREVLEFPEFTALDAGARDAAAETPLDAAAVDGARADARCMSDCGAHLDIVAGVDGISDLIIKGETVHWHHLKYVPPNSTTINGVPWKPVWPTPSVSCNCDSSTTTIAPALPRRPQTVALTLVTGRFPVTLEQPSEQNDFQLIVHFDDDASGPATYQIALDYAP